MTGMAGSPGSRNTSNVTSLATTVDEVSGKALNFTTTTTIMATALPRHPDARTQVNSGRRLISPSPGWPFSPPPGPSKILPGKIKPPLEVGRSMVCGSHTMASSVSSSSSSSSSRSTLRICISRSTSTSSKTSASPTT